MSEYMLDLRKIIGSRPVFQNGASVMVINKAGELLLGLRSDNKCWGYAGGSIEMGEKLEEAAARELKEEFGIKATSLELFNVFSGQEMYYQYPNGDEVYNIDTVFICRNYEGDLRPDGHEITDVRFFSFDSLPDNISPPNLPVLDEYRKRYL